MLCCRLKWIACIVVLLLLCVMRPDMSEGRTGWAPQSTLSDTYISEISEETSDQIVFCRFGDEIFAHLLGTNRWGISSSTLYMQVLTGRPLSFGAHLQRTVRTAITNLCANIAAENLRDTLCHTVASIRFHIGYFIYHRCQMRC